MIKSSFCLPYFFKDSMSRHSHIWGTLGVRISCVNQGKSSSCNPIQPTHYLQMGKVSHVCVSMWGRIPSSKTIFAWLKCLKDEEEMRMTGWFQVTHSASDPSIALQWMCCSAGKVAVHIPSGQLSFRSCDIPGSDWERCGMFNRGHKLVCDPQDHDSWTTPSLSGPQHQGAPERIPQT